MRLIITDEDDASDYEELDSRETSPADIGDALAGLIDDHRVEEAVLITADKDGEMLLLSTDMTNTELLGFLAIAVANYTHALQHGDD